jgi:membrane protein DedA with SNARE-associated domain
MAAESALIPIPSEVIMPFSGLLVYEGRFNFILVVLAGAFGNLAGSLVAYYLGFWGQSNVRRLIRRWGRFLLITEEDLDLSISWFDRFGSPIVFIGRILPVVRTFISLPAGIARMNLTKFIVYSFAGSLIWSIFLTYLGFVLRENWEFLSPYFRKFDVLIVFGGIILIAAYLYHKLRRK